MTTKVELSSVVDAAVDAELVAFPPSTIQSMRAEYASVCGPPSPGQEPSAEEFPAAKQLLDSFAPPRLDIS
eukprot:11207478-Lingulodinium_polyedra.AAC.1